MSIVLKDIFKPRYAIVVTLENMPQSILEAGYMAVPCVSMLPFKRPLDMSFNAFYNTLIKRYGIQSMTIAGSYWTLRGLYGVGSCLKHNMKNAVILKHDC